MKIAVVGLLLAATMAQAQTGSAGFPDGSEALTQEQLKAALTDKVFAVQAAQGPAWRWEFKSNGYFYINVGNFSDSGKWSAKDSSVCTEGRQIKASCNEVRSHTKDLYLKRDSGEIVKLVAM